MATTPNIHGRLQKRLDELMRAGYSLLGLALGYDLGLIQALGDLNRPVTASDLAEKADCKERYVREWLLQMTMAEFLEMDDSCDLFSLPEGSLEGLKTLAWSAAIITTMANAHGKLVDVFRSSGPRGFPDSVCRPMLKCFDGPKKELWQQCPNLVKGIPGLHAALETGCDVLDIGCHTGDFITTMATHFPKNTFYGVDLSNEAIATARQKASSNSMSNIRFEVEDAAELPAEWFGKFDAIFLFNTFHDLPLASAVCLEIRRVLAPKGHCFVRDINVHSDPREQKKNPVFSTELYAYSLYLCLPMSMNTPNSEGLGTCLGSQKIVEMMEKTGLKQVAASEMRLPENQNHCLVFSKENFLPETSTNQDRISE